MNSTEILSIIGRNAPLFEEDIQSHATKLSNEISTSNFLVLGAAGSIGQAVTKEIFKRNPKKLHVVDISENNLVELVRDLRSSYGYISGEFKSFALDIGSLEYDAFFEKDGSYDFILNLSALKHVRSEKDDFTLMRMINVNILNTVKTIEQAIEKGCKKYFCVSTDKAANPVNMMGASKRIMESYLWQYVDKIAISTARFANVAFSDGSLLHGFQKRIEKKQPLVAPSDVKRYFVTPQESGELCLMSCIFGLSGDTFFPKLVDQFQLTSFQSIAENYLKYKGLNPYLCESEIDARSFFNTNFSTKGLWPCLFTKSDTTGEKPYEEFFTSEEQIDSNSYQNLGVIKNEMNYDSEILNYFLNAIHSMRNSKKWNKVAIIELFKRVIPSFEHEEKGKFLDSKM